MMNKVQNVFLGIIVIVLFSCYTDNTYQIAGIVEGAKNGDTVLMYRWNGKKSIPVDTAIIFNGHFEFTGRVDSTVAHNMLFRQGGQLVRMTFFLEPGHIRMKVFKEGRKELNGTLLNEIWNAYNVQKDSMYAERAKIYSLLKDSMLDNEVRSAYWKSIFLKLRCDHSYMICTIETNIDNPIGLFLLTSNYRGIELGTLDTILGRLPDKYQENKLVKDIRKYLSVEKATSVGQHFMDFEMPTPEGKQVRLSNYIYKNKITLLEFWASWCGPCCKEMPNLARLYHLYKNKGLEIVGVSLDDDKDKWKKAIEMLNISWIQMSEGGRGNACQQYGIQKIPTMFLIDQDGIIIAKNISVKGVFDRLEEILK